MDGNQDVTDQLAKLLSDVSSIFQCVVYEKNKLKHENEKSVASVDSLLAEITNLKRENELLRKTNSSHNSCETCTELRKKLVIQITKSKKLEMILDLLSCEILNKVPYKSLSPTFKGLMTQINRLKTEGPLENGLGLDNVYHSNCKSLISDNTSCQSPQKVIVSGNFYGSNKATGKYFEGKLEENKTTVKNNEKVGNISTHLEPGVRSSENSYLDIIPTTTEKIISSNAVNVEFRTPTKSDKNDSDFIGSPVCENSFKMGEISPVLVDQHFLQNCHTLLTSPNRYKRKASEIGSDSPRKLVEKKLFQSPKSGKFSSPRKAAKYTLQSGSGNSSKPQNSPSDTRKLRQTQLNFEYYRSKAQEKSKSDNGNTDEHRLKEKSLNDEKTDEDDLILDTPRHLPSIFSDFRKSDKDECTIRFVKEEQEQVRDPEETFVDTQILSEVQEESYDAESKKENSSKCYQSSPEYDPMPYPEYDPVPYLYKGSPVRKKSERMKLPGQVCMECDKYYKAVFGEGRSDKMQQILNKCSRHRDQHYNITNTPPGYWTAYLDSSRDEDDY